MEVIDFFISGAIMSLIMFVLHSLKSRKARFTYNRFVLRYPIAIRLLFFVALLVFSLGPIYLSKLHPEKEIEEYLSFLPLILITLIGFLEAQRGCPIRC
jgi:NADH:ubiquinone oxidoreductase subunit 6 (subunit J)